MVTCSVKNCFAERVKDDSLFCEDCRKGWRIFILNLGIPTTGFPHEETLKLLDLFQKTRLEAKI